MSLKLSFAAIFAGLAETKTSVQTQPGGMVCSRKPLGTIWY